VFASVVCVRDVRDAPISLRTVTDGLLPRRRCAHRAVQLDPRAAQRRYFRPAHRGHGRIAQRTAVDAGDHRCARMDRNFRWRPALRGAVLPVGERSGAHCRCAASLRIGYGVLLRPHGRAGAGAGKDARCARLRRLLARSRTRPGPRSGVALPRSGGNGRRQRRRARRGVVRAHRDRGLRAAARQRHPGLPAR